MNKLILSFVLLIWIINISFASETTGTIDTWLSTSGLDFSLPCNPTSVSNGSVNAKTCAITCNSGYNISWNSCVQPPSSSWGWGWGWGWWSTVSTCIDTELECKTYLNSYVWFQKSWGTCQWGNLWKACTISEISSLSPTNSWTVITTFSGVTTTLQSTLLSATVQSYINQLWIEISKNIDVKKAEIYTAFDKDLSAKYQELLDTYQTMIKALDMYAQTKDKQYITQYQDLQKKYKSLLQELKDLDGRYIQKVIVNNIEVYKSRDEKLLIITDKIEKIVFKKLNKKIFLKTINQDEYARLVSHYNYFILQINIFKKFNLTISKQEAKNALLNLIKAWL